MPASSAEVAPARPYSVPSCLARPIQGPKRALGLFPEPLSPSFVFTNLSSIRKSWPPGTGTSAQSEHHPAITPTTIGRTRTSHASSPRMGRDKGALWPALRPLVTLPDLSPSQRSSPPWARSKIGVQLSDLANYGILRPALIRLRFSDSELCGSRAPGPNQFPSLRSHPPDHRAARVFAEFCRFSRPFSVNHDRQQRHGGHFLMPRKR